jgi:two-component system chemotaxis response regulator CheY
MKILVVEDSSSMRAYLTTIIEGTEIDDLDIVEAASGFEALKTLPHHRFDAILTDINMPDINGLELLRFVRQGPQHRDTAVLVISTMSSERDRERALALGADVFLPKPFSPEALREAVARCRELRGGGSARPEVS